MGNCCCKFKLLEIYELLSQADVGVSRGSRVNCRGLRVAGRGSRVAGKKSRVRNIVAGPENCRGSKNSTLIVKIEFFLF